MKTVEEIKAEASTAQSFLTKIWLAVVAFCAVLDLVFGFDGAISVAFVLVIPFQLFSAARLSRITGDQFAIFSVYRLYAIVLTFMFASVLLTEQLKKSGFEIGLSTHTVVLVSCMTGLLGLTFFDWLFGKNGTE